MSLAWRGSNKHHLPGSSSGSSMTSVASVASCGVRGGARRAVDAETSYVVCTSYVGELLRLIINYRNHCLCANRPLPAVLRCAGATEIACSFLPVDAQWIHCNGTPRRYHAMNVAPSFPQGCLHPPCALLAWHLCELLGLSPRVNVCVPARHVMF